MMSMTDGISKFINQIIAITVRILLEWYRRKRNLFFWGIFPLTILVINGLIVAERGQIPFNQAVENAASPSLIGAALFFSCLGGTVAIIVAEREQQTLKRLFLSGLNGLSYFLGIFLAQSIVAIAQTLLVYILASYLGADLKGSVILSGFIILLTIIAYVGGGFILGTCLAKETEDVNTLVAAIGVPLLLLGGVFVPAWIFPKILQDVAYYNPIYHMNEALNRVWANGDKIEQIQTSLVIVVVVALLLVILGGWSYYWMLRTEKRI